MVDEQFTNSEVLNHWYRSPLLLLLSHDDSSGRRNCIRRSGFVTALNEIFIFRFSFFIFYFLFFVFLFLILFFDISFFIIQVGTTSLPALYPRASPPCRTLKPCSWPTATSEDRCLPGLVNWQVRTRLFFFFSFVLFHLFIYSFPPLS